MTTDVEFTNAVTEILSRISTNKQDISDVKSQLGTTNLTQLEARVGTGETRYVETQQDIQALQSLFNTDHYQVIPTLVADNLSQQLEINDLKNRIAILETFVNTIKDL